jgi:hypothetical protein
MAARRGTPGTRQLNLEIDEGLFEAFEAFIAARGQTKRFAVEKAMRRHLESPPPILPDPLLPPGEPDPAVPQEPPKKRGPKPKK